MKPKQVKPTVFEGLPAEAASATSTNLPDRNAIPDRPARIDQTPAFRPVRRPPMAILEVLDDGQETGEIFRIRSDSISIGREEGNVIISHDDQISRKHVEIAREIVNGEYLWILRDLRSTNGTFFRVQKARLIAGASVLLGCREYQFRPPSGSVSPAGPARPAMATVLSSDAATEANLQRLQTSLVRILPDKSEIAFPFQPDSKQPILVGSDSSQCRVVIADDPTVSPVHAAIESRDEGLVLADRKSRNGLWVRIKERKLPETAQFQIGEQRLRFRVC